MAARLIQDTTATQDFRVSEASWKLVLNYFLWLEAKMASRLVQLRRGKEATLRPEKVGIWCGLGFAASKETNWPMLAVCWLKLGFRSLLEASSQQVLVAGRQ